MSDQIDKIAESLRVNLTRIADQLHGASRDLSVEARKDCKTMDAKLQAARQGLVSAKSAMRGAEEKAQSWIRAQQQAGTTGMENWKAKLDRFQMSRHAELAADNAASASLLAEAAVFNAVVAAYEAVGARRAADELPKV